MESSWQCRLARHVMSSVLNTRPCLVHTPLTIQGYPELIFYHAPKYP